MTIGNCLNCITDNTACPDTWFLTVRSCCDPLVVEVIETTIIATTGTIFQDTNGVCWEIMSWSISGTSTWPVPIKVNGSYNTCNACLLDVGGADSCPDFYLFSGCCFTETSQVAYGVYTVGQTYFNEDDRLCYECVSTTTGPATASSIPYNAPYGNCEQCTEVNPCPTYRVKDCCNVLEDKIVAYPPVTTIGESFFDSTSGTCWEILGQINETPTMTLGTTTDYNTGCADCISSYPCA